MTGPGAAPGAGQDRAAQAAALESLLRAEPAEWPLLAPAVVRQLGPERLRGIVEATRERVGAVEAVYDAPDGLVIRGARAAVLGWARLGEDGALQDLRISPSLRGNGGRTPRLPPSAVRWAVRAALCLLFASRVDGCWGAASRTGWLGGALLLAALYLLYEGWFNPAMEPWWIRRPIESGAVVALASAVRLPALPDGGDVIGPVLGAALLALAAGLLVRARRYRPPVGTAAPLDRFPMDGAWYIVQGGGPGLNHHLRAPEQRGALDLLRVGPGGSHRGDPAALGSYPAYGARVYAPCAGTVVSAADGIEDQVPGAVRYAPLYGNHVFINTGSETVRLAHLRPGSLAVTTGQTVSAGQFLGEVGNSGNSSEPHLHLHAERDGQGLALRFTGVAGHLHRGRTVHA
ncbi:M23 family metallopeptidase [Streptacidiphilus sp. N1-12]|uniref:M23 family metallopeptidase n=2 Tax=Streptacidiphilus alkalitolerans TaxID=3342712 RepID=A0ABV6WK85_9ACTN